MLAQVEPDAGDAVGLDAVEDRRGDRVAGRQLVGEAPPGGVEQGRALAADRLGDQRAVEARARQRQRGRVELAELEVGQVGARGARQRRPGADRAPGVGGPPPERRGAAGREHGRRRRDRAGVGQHAVAALAVAPQRHGGGALADRDSRLGGDHRRQLRGDLVAGLAAAGVDDAPPGVAALEAERQLAVGVEVEGDARARAARAPPPAPPRSAPRRPTGRQRPRPAAIVSAAWLAGESPGSSAAARPPWAQKLALWESGVRETRQTRRRARRRAAPSTARPRRRRRRRRRTRLVAAIAAPPLAGSPRPDRAARPRPLRGRAPRRRRSCPPRRRHAAPPPRPASRPPRPVPRSRRAGPRRRRSPAPWRSRSRRSSSSWLAAQFLQSLGVRACAARAPRPLLSLPLQVRFERPISAVGALLGGGGRLGCLAQPALGRLDLRPQVLAARLARSRSSRSIYYAAARTSR